MKKLLLFLCPLLLSFNIFAMTQHCIEGSCFIENDEQHFVKNESLDYLKNFDIFNEKNYVVVSNEEYRKLNSEVESTILYICDCEEKELSACGHAIVAGTIAGGISGAAAGAGVGAAVGSPVVAVGAAVALGAVGAAGGASAGRSSDACLEAERNQRNARHEGITITHVYR